MQHASGRLAAAAAERSGGHLVGRRLAPAHVLENEQQKTGKREAGRRPQGVPLTGRRLGEGIGGRRRHGSRSAAMVWWHGRAVREVLQAAAVSHDVRDRGHIESFETGGNFAFRYTALHRSTR